jgi:hypothetical protein
MNEREVVLLMASSKSTDEWNTNAEIVKAAFDGYPEFWYEAILASGVAIRTLAKFGESDELKITTT